MKRNLSASTFLFNSLAALISWYASPYYGTIPLSKSGPHLMFGLRTLCHSRSLEAIRFQLRIRTSRYQSTGNCLCLLPRIHRSLVLTRNAAAVSSVNSLPPALLERARSIFAEHSQLSKDLANEYDITVARKLGELSSTAKALEHWESAQKVCATYS